MKLNINEESGYTYDYRYKLPDDIIYVVPPKIYKSDMKNKIYWFGYKFRNNVSPEQRTDFINYINGIGDNKISESHLRQFIELPLGEPDKRINIYSLDCFVAPGSKRSQLVKKMISVIGGYTAHETKRCTFELVKNVPTDIEFDFELFEHDTEDDKNQHDQMLNYINNVLMPKIKKLDYFSLAKNVKPKYRKYIKNHLNFSPEDFEIFSKLQGKKILVIDDINTSGATLNEILRVLNKINNGCEIFVYTLIGKD